VIKQTDSHSRAGEAQNVLTPTLEFLRQHAPFDRMAAPPLEFLAKHLRLGYHPKGKLIAEPGHGPARTFYIIKQGRVRGEVDGGRRPTEGELWELTPGECFPIGALLARRPIAIKQRAVEDTFCFELDRDEFEKLLTQSPVFHDFCSRRIASLLDEALRGTQANLATQASNDGSLNAPLSSLIKRAPVTCLPHTPLSQALAHMHAERVGSIVALDGHGAPLGIFTLHDLLGRVATRGLALDTPIERAMTPKPLTIAAHASAYEAAVTMARHSVGHLCIVERGRLVGVVSERDLFALQRIGLVHLARAIMQAPDVATLAQHGHDVHRLVDQMLMQGASVVQLTQIVALLNDHVTRRAIALCVAEAGFGTALPFAWLSFGSEGRQEQTLKTDQDNGMMLFPPSRRSGEELRRQLLPLARRINETLAACGYPLCAGNVMASNPECCLTAEEWRARFDKWIEHGAPEHLLSVSIYFDFRALDGDAEPVEELRHWVLQRARRVPRFLRQVAENALRNPPPLGFMRDFVLEDGEHADTINLKLRGSSPFVDGARLFALANGIPETNTLARLRAAVQHEVVRASEVDAWSDAYSFILLLRMRHHRAQERAAHGLDNFVNPERLNELDRRVLKEAFRQARKLQSTIALEYLR
jgi:CBS domain-containing protein